MTKHTTFALTAAAAAALAASLSANAAFVDIPDLGGDFYSTTITVGTFCGGTTPDTYRTPRYSFTCFKTGAGFSLDPSATHMANTDLPGTTPITIQELTLGGIVTGSLNMNVAGNTATTGQLSYFIELAPGYDPAADPDIKFDNITLSQETLTAGDPENTSARKQITGQNNVVVTDASFAETLNTVGQATGGSTADSTACGVCRKFAVTDSYTNDADGPGGLNPGRIQSLSNAYDTLEQPEVPVPAPLALMAIGLIGIGAARRHRKA
jgi:hypothetical protein